MIQLILVDVVAMTIPTDPTPFGGSGSGGSGDKLLRCHHNWSSILVGIVVPVRTEFAYLGQVRSIVPPSVRVMALTATAIITTRKYVIKSLNMQAPEIVNVSPKIYRARKAQRYWRLLQRNCRSTKSREKHGKKKNIL